MRIKVRIRVRVKVRHLNMGGHRMSLRRARGMSFKTRIAERVRVGEGQHETQLS